MATGRLPEHEQHLLEEIEADLRHDRRLSRRLRLLRLLGRLRIVWLAERLRRRAGAVSNRLSVSMVGALTLVSVILTVAGIRTSEPAVIWAFAIIWPLTLFAAFRLLCRWSR